MGSTEGAAFYCMSSAMYFLGAVGMVNSLRLHGHDEPVFLLDCGLSDDQRELLAPHVTLVEAPTDTEPFMLKTVAPLAHPAEVMVLIDADMIVTRSLDEPIEAAAGERVVAVRHPEDRFFDDWGELLGLDHRSPIPAPPGTHGSGIDHPGSTRRHPYLSSGLVFLGGNLGEEVVRLMDGAQHSVDFERTQFRTDFPDYPFISSAPTAPRDYPFFFADQDVLNAVLAARVEPERVVGLDERLAPTPPFEGVRISDERALRCALDDGAEPLVLHHYLAKPWLEPTHHGVYSRLLRRLLLASDVPIRVPEEELPLRFRSGPLAFLARSRVNARERFRYHVAEPLRGRRTAAGR